MNIFFISLFLLSAPTVSQVVKADNFSHDWENHHVLHINRLPARAAFVPYRQKVGDSSYSLNGEWKFRWTPVPDERIFDFYRTEFDDSGWEDFLVPSNWENRGYGTPIYVSAGYPFRIDPVLLRKITLPIRNVILSASIAGRLHCRPIGKGMEKCCYALTA